MNKYLEKIALFGFSKEEKQNKAATRLYMDTNNHFADHINPRYAAINAGTDIDATKDQQGYLDYLKKTVKKEAALYDSYKPIYEKHKAKLKELGVDLPSDYKTFMDDFIDSQYQPYSY